MELREMMDGDAVILEVHGRIDSSVTKSFGDKLADIMTGDCHRLLLDFKQLSYINSAGLRALLIAGKAANAHGCKFGICSLTPEIRRLFELGGFTELFTIKASREDGLASLR